MKNDNGFKVLTKTIKDNLHKNHEEEQKKKLENGVENEKTTEEKLISEKTYKKYARHLATKTVRKHYKEKKIKHFGGFKAIKPLNYGK